MPKERYKIETSCPQCGCSAVSNLSHDEIMEKFGDVPNIETDCRECMLKYTTSMETACAEWDEECKLNR